jgi:hypothetical protein
VGDETETQGSFGRLGFSKRKVLVKRYYYIGDYDLGERTTVVEPFAMSLFFRKGGGRQGAGPNVEFLSPKASTGFTNTVDNSHLHFSHFKVTPPHH